MSQEAADKIKLQIPVSRELADAIADLAKRLEWSQARMAAKLLGFALDDPAIVGSWLRRRVIGPGTEKRRMGWLQRGNNSAVRLQVHVSESDAQKLEDLANRLNHTPVRMAALLLDFAVDDYQWVVRVLSTKIGRAVMRWLGDAPEGYQSAEEPLDDERPQ